MPKVNSLIPDPPVDLLLAVMLERKQALNLTYDIIAQKTGFASAYLRQMFSKKSPWDWPPETRRKVCKALKVPDRYIQESAR